MYEERVYRDKQQSNDLTTYHIIIDESDLMISSDIKAEETAYSLLENLRKRIRTACLSIAGFEASLVPINKTSDDPIIQHMIDVSTKAGVGPMAAVAGTISEQVVLETISLTDTTQMIAENGGDIFISSKEERKILIYAGDSPFSNKIGIRIPAADMPIGICTSAGTVGHSLSFGNADAVVVISKDTSLADAVATAVGNLVVCKEDIKRGLDFGKSIEGIQGILIIIDDKMGAWGQIEIFQA
ncbi:MAG: UPF0280 family protein [Peptostreptococcaceae bacterium]|nr:UPF0280 family protein [Peptostreptococcaceae bacterium]